jgi:hypothetical protein
MSDRSVTPQQPRARRVVLSLVIGCASALIAVIASGLPNVGGWPDFALWWTAARAMMDGQDPYLAISRLGPGAFLYYPLPAVLATYPFALFRMNVALPLFSGISAAILAWAVLSNNEERWPLFLSFSFVHAAVMGQWAMLLTAALLLPVMGFVAGFKPNIGVSVVLSRLSWRTVAAVVLVYLLSFWVMPSWPKEWWQAAHGSLIHFSLWRVPGGIFTFLALLRWRRPEARMVAALGAVPLSPFAGEALPLFVVPRTRWESYLLVALSDIVLLVYAWSRSLDFGEILRVNGLAVTFFLYVPATIMVLRRPNEGEVPLAVERLARLLPTRLRGSVAAR